MGEPFRREEFVAGYLAEAEEHVQAAGKNLLRIEQGLERSEPQPKIVRELFRSLHTLKGLSAMVGVEPVVAIAHEMETILRVADQEATPLSRPALELLLSGLAAIDLRVRAFAKRELVTPAPAALLEALKAHLGAAALLPPRAAALSLPAELLRKLSRSEHEQLSLGIKRGQRAIRIDFSPSPEKAARGLSITSVRERVAKLADVVKVVPSSLPKTAASPGGLVFTLLVLTSASNPALLEAAAAEADSLVEIVADESSEEEAAPPYEAEDGEQEGEGPLSGTIRVRVTRLDDALEKLSTLVVSRFRLARAVEDLRARGVDVRELHALLNEHAREMKHLRAAITRARMVSVSQLLERVPLLVRGMSKSAGKPVKLQIDAGRSELDKGVAERVFPAILHLVRNAVDHAIEPPDERARAGKPAAGTVTIRCFERSDNRLELSVSDDGRGVDRARVAQKARTALPQDDAALLALISRAGLSTQEVATERSGRGMGMDIVRRIALETLGGELTLHTTPKVGTTFTLQIPLSISIVDSIIFRCAEQTFAAPLGMIEEIVELSRVKLVRSPAPNSAAPIGMMRQRDNDVPVFELKDLFGMSRAEPAQSAVIVRRGDSRFAFAVDRMLSQQELVIRALEDPLVKVPGVSGTADLGDGRPTLVLDLVGLSAVAGARAQAVSP